MACRKIPHLVPSLSHSKTIIKHIDTWIDEHFPAMAMTPDTQVPAQSLKAASFVGGSQQICKSIGRHGTDRSYVMVAVLGLPARRCFRFMTPGDISSDTWV